MIKSKKQMYIVVGVFALVLMLFTTTYAFFNYTRTGVANNIRTGRIYFNTSQSGTLNLTNVFPMSATDAGNANLDQVSVRIQGDTTYADGEEYEISIVDVNNTINNKTIPINYIASYSATPVQSGDPNVIGTNSDSYFTARGSTTAVYQLKSTGEASNGDQVLVGYIPANVAIDGTLTIKAYLDVDNVVISDTYPSGTVRNVITTNYSSSDCETVLDGVTNASAYCATASSLQDAIDNEDITDAQITLLVNAGIVEEYTNGTPASFGEGKTVLTTAEWNSLQNTQTPLSFKIKAVSQEGTWVEDPQEPIPTIDSCPGCKFVFTYNEYYFENKLEDFENNNDILVDDYTILIDDYSGLNRTYFLGFKFDEQGNITNGYACGIKQSISNGSTPFCLEKVDSNSQRANEVYTSNRNLITGPTLWNDPNLENECSDYNNEIICGSANDDGVDSWLRPVPAGNSSIGTGGERCYAAGDEHSSFYCDHG